MSTSLPVGNAGSGTGATSGDLGLNQAGNLQNLQNLQKDAADLRREQLVAIASQLIESEGIDAAKHSRIAKLAGCTRSLVYHYFPARSDIFSAINAAFYRSLDALMPVDDQQEALRENLRGDKPNSLKLFGILFDLLENGGWSSMILRSTPELNSDFAAYLESIQDSYEKRWRDVIAEHFSMSEVDCALFFQHTVHIAKTTFLFYRKGQLSKQQAIEKLDVAVNQLLNPYR